MTKLLTRFLAIGLMAITIIGSPSDANGSIRISRKIEKTTNAATQWLVLSLNTGVSKQKVSFVSTFSGWDPDKIVLSEIRKGYYTLSIPSPWVPAFYYKFVVDGRWSHDPENPQREPDGYGGYNSIFETGFQENTKFDTPKPNLAWQKSDVKIKTSEGTTREVTILAPPFRSKLVLPTVYFNDGNDYLNQASIKNFLANYFEQTGRAIVAVLVSPVARETEYGASQKNSLDAFLVNKVIPYVESKFLTGGAAAKRMLIGPSLGGLSSTRTGFVTKAFGFISSQSGSFWYIEDKLEDLIKNRVNTPKMYLTYGFFETDGIVDSNKKIKSLLTTYGVPFEMFETPTGHNWISWRNQLESVVDWFIQNQ